MLLLATVCLLNYFNSTFPLLFAPVLLQQEMTEYIKNGIILAVVKVNHANIGSVGFIYMEMYSIHFVVQLCQKIPASKLSNPLINKTLSSLEKVRRPKARDNMIRRNVENSPTNAFWKRKKYVNQ